MVEENSSRHRSLIEYRRGLLEHSEAEVALFDRAILFISPAALAFSMTMGLLADHHGDAGSPAWWIASWVALGTAPVLVTASCVHAACADRRRLDIVDLIIMGKLEDDDAEFAAPVWERVCTHLTKAAGLAFAVGIVCLVVAMAGALAAAR